MASAANTGLASGQISSRTLIIWFATVIILLTPIFLATRSPYLAWREPVYIAAGFAGIFAMSLLAIQPILAVGYIPGLTFHRQRQGHRWIGVLLVLAIALHVLGLWVTSPPDVIDALLFRSPTPFSAWGVIAMWALLVSALLTQFRKSIGLHRWRWSHRTLALVIVVGSAVHAVLIEGAMEVISKFAICALAIGALLFVSIRLTAKRRLQVNRQ